MSNLAAQELMQSRMADKQRYERFAISMPAHMAERIRELCQVEARSHSEFFREAVRTYLTQRASGFAASHSPLHVSSELFPQAIRSTPASGPVIREQRSAAAGSDDTFADFSEWASDKEYDALVEHPSLDLWDQKQA